MNSQKRLEAFRKETIAPDGSIVDTCFLQYEDGRGGLPIRMPLSPTKYAIAVSMLSSKGLDPVDVANIRSRIRSAKLSEPSSEFISLNFLKSRMSNFRQEVENLFGGRVVVPHMRTGRRINGLKIWLKEDYDAVYASMKEPGLGVVTIQDPSLLWHLYVNGYEILPRGSGGIAAIEKEIIVRAGTKEGFCRHRAEFKKVCAELTGNEDLPPRGLASFLSRCRNALNQIPPTSRMEITMGTADGIYRLVPHQPVTSVRINLQAADDHVVH